ncbi:MAG: hypothetical protein IPQ16_02495 [Geobacteraceae bacterium]|nr:hypothetical protein [Geobacteraceae bacterium]
MMKHVNSEKPIAPTALSIGCLLVLVQLLILPGFAVAGVAVDCKGSEAAYRAQGIPCTCVNGQIVCTGTAKPKVGGSKGLSSAAQMKGMVFGAVFESVLTSLFATPQDSQADIQAAQQRAAELAWQQEQERQAREAAAQAAYDRMMQSYKQLDDAAAASFKTISDSNLSFKGLDGDYETMAANARKPFDTAGDLVPPPVPPDPGVPTQFFGDTMPLSDIKLLANPENDPRVADLREANSYVVQSIKTDEEKMDSAVRKQQDKQAKTSKTKEQCVALAKKLDGFLAQRNRFQKTIYQGQEQLNVWEEANRAALVNAAKDGFEYFAGIFLEVLKDRAEYAETVLQRINAQRENLARAGYNISAYEAKLNRFKAIGTASDNIAKANDWQTMMKDGISSLVAQLSSSNDEIKAMMEEPIMQQLFTTESPRLNLLLDISKMAAAEKVFGKWVARQVPIIGMVEITIKQTYNATDWFLSFKRITEANNINGQIMTSARSLQHHIDETYTELQQCN